MLAAVDVSGRRRRDDSREDCQRHQGCTPHLRDFREASGRPCTRFYLSWAARVADAGSVRAAATRHRPGAVAGALGAADARALAGAVAGTLASTTRAAPLRAKRVQGR